jgi:hypothetical protein
MDNIDELIQKLMLNGISSREEDDDEDYTKRVTDDTLKERKLREVAYRWNNKVPTSLSMTTFSIFEHVADLGYFGWEPCGVHKKLKMVTTLEIKNNIKLNRKPLKVLSIVSLNRQVPKPFAILPKEEFIYRYPYKQPNIVPVFVALKHRGVKKQDLDFFFGGSTLNMLANCSTGNKEYVVALIPGTKIIMITSYKEYVQDKSAFGFQFERLVTGHKFEDEYSDEEIHHIQLMKVGNYLVLFSAECDAMDADGNPVEITTSNPVYRGTRSLYQMLSNGSSVLYQGSKSQGILTKVEAMSFSEIESSCQKRFDLKLQEERIIDSMIYLEEEFENERFDEGKAFKITFNGSRIELKPFDAIERIFPATSVIKDLIT